MVKDKLQNRRAREIGYAMVNAMQDRRKLYRFANMLVNVLAEVKPEALTDMSNIYLSISERQTLKDIMEKIK